MPIEIRELVIKATVVQDVTELAGAVPHSSNNNVSANEEIITICVEKIMEILKDKDAR